MKALSVEGLSKQYASFTLQDVSFSVSAGQIMGLIGKNGAGKTTTLKCILNMVCPSAGQIQMLGRAFPINEVFCKQRIGVVLGGIDFYQHKKLKDITHVTRRFYPNWDQPAYTHYMKEFGLDEGKTVSELSSGMRVKYLIALALSHQAQLLILDEPTSGLDPVSREELLALFKALVRDGKRSVLFSTHITSDLEKCADEITYIKEGKVLASDSITSFAKGFEHLRERGETGLLTLEEIMIRTERSSRNDKLAV